MSCCRHAGIAAFVFILLMALLVTAVPVMAGQPVVVKKMLTADNTSGTNLLKANAWRPYVEGFTRDGDTFLCDNANDVNVKRGVQQTVVLNQTQPKPLVATAASRAENVSGSADPNYSVYLDLTYTDGTHLYGQSASFATNTHDWKSSRVVIFPEKPVRQLSYYLLFRSHTGKAWFRAPTLTEIEIPTGATVFDTLPVVVQQAGKGRFQIRDVAAQGDVVQLDGNPLGIQSQVEETTQDGSTFFDVTLIDTTGRDRAVTLFYAVPLPRNGLNWLQDPRHSKPVAPLQEYVSTSGFRVGANGRLSRWPLAAVANEKHGTALGIDMRRPAFFRIGYSAGTEELYIAYDIALTPEKPSARVRFCQFHFDPSWGFRGALARYYELFPPYFQCRVPRQGLWMPFARISKVEGWEDFGFAFKEGNNETAWDDEHGILTFRYTEPTTWWMAMDKSLPRTLEAAVAEARRLAAAGNRSAQALLSSGFHDSEGRLVARLRDTPWCNGAVWSLNSMPGIQGEVADFQNRWNETIKERLYGPNRRGDLDGEYFDSCGGYVTDDLDFRREHFAAADTPLTFAFDTQRPAIFKGLILFESIRAMANDLHANGKFVQANGPVSRFCWLAALVDVMGTETNWHRDGHWRPMPDTEMLYRRAMCQGKPYCFLMNTEFSEFPPELVEKYMKRALAYGMFPGFFSHNASEGHYFSRSELYNRDRPLFKRYVPLCRTVAEAGWQPITLARTNGEKVYVERFGEKYLTVLNDSPQRRDVTIRLEGLDATDGHELLSGRPVVWQNGQTTLTLDAEDVAVIELR